MLRKSLYFVSEECKSHLNLQVVLSSGETVADLKPMFEKIQKLPCRGMTITALAPSDSGFDIYSRFFCPKYGIKEVSLKLNIRIP